MMNTPCDWVRSQLPPYVDGDLNPELAERVSGHLERCSSCRNVLAEEEALVTTAVHALVEAEPPRGFQDRVVATLTRPTLPRVSPAASELARRRLPWSYAAAAVLLLSLLGLLLPETEKTPTHVAGPSPSPTTPTADDPSAEKTAPVLVSTDDPEVHFRPGDIDSDGTVTVADLELHQKLIENASGVASNAVCVRAADLDHDGELTLADSVLMCSLLGDSFRRNELVAYDPKQSPFSCAVPDCAN